MSLDELARRLGGDLVRAWPLTGGVSAEVHGIEIRRGDRIDRLVARRHADNDWKGHGASVLATEHTAMEACARAGLPVPLPELHEPYLVMPFVEDSTVPADLDDALPRMATFLTRLHALEPVALPARGQPLPDLFEWLPSDLDVDLEGFEPRTERDVILHGDFWPGNILWAVDGSIAAVIDWEDAAVGDPHADLAGCRVELLYKYGMPAAERFTELYLRDAPQPVDAVALAVWELYVTSAGLAYMHQWGLDPDVEATMRTRGRAFLERAAAACRA